MHDTSTNNSRLICKTAGKYQINANIAWALNATGVRELGLFLNGTTGIAYVSVPGSATLSEQSISTLYDLAVNDYVEVSVYQTSGGALNVTASPNYSPEFMMGRIG
jgi:hypothetical protein